MVTIAGYRKLIACLAGVASATLAVGMAWIEGAQYVTVMTVCVGGYLAANYAAKQKTQSL